MYHRARIRILTSLAGVVLAGGFAGPAGAAPGVDPATVDQPADPGTSIVIHKTVTTPAIPPNPDIVLLVDTTTSMGAVIGAVQANLSGIVGNVQGAQPTAEFAVARYKTPPTSPVWPRSRCSRASPATRRTYRPR